MIPVPDKPIKLGYGSKDIAVPPNFLITRRSDPASSHVTMSHIDWAETPVPEHEDALDEMDAGSSAFIKQIASLGPWRPRAVKVLFTSRPVPKFELPIRKIPSIVIRQDEKHVDMDISTYVRSALAKSSISLT
ncbi:ankyrin repeat-containing protein [Fusarium pseudoanthophilum]|uniref:Ankyrin repeat-containing protein n=1 Tax=Fusarium pseudoanthophilum TaxID=48495 RepID=A0A8H5P3V6_9HYPO|nr:ankyrin repeat-containing protein [Fusarium pseudoanthophilum]